MRERTNIFGDGIGYVRIIDRMGDDFTPAEDARMSTGKGRLGPEKDTALQERLMKDNHTSPFEGVIVKVEVGAPLYVIREADRHRTEDKNSEFDPFDHVLPEENLRKWMARNEMSGRYIQMPDLYYHPVAVRGQSTTNKQGGSADTVSISPEVAEEFISRGKELSTKARELYSWAIERGIEKGMARNYNTQNQYTFIRYTGSLKNWLDALALRRPAAVLWECRQVFESIYELLKEELPQAMSSWDRLVYNGVRLNGDERKVLEQLLKFYYADDWYLENVVPGGVETMQQLCKKLGVK